MTKPRERSYLSLNSGGFSRIVYDDWGSENAPPVICVHGLTGNAYDFNWLAPALVEDGYRVLSIDMPGRGRSDYIANDTDYSYAQYVQDLTGLMTHVGITQPRSVDWIGISMGGLLGIRMAGQPNSPIRRLMLDDIGPVVPQADLDMINEHIADMAIFDSVKAVEQSLREGRGPHVGPMREDQWIELGRNNARKLPDGRYTYTYDHRIASVFIKEPLGEIPLWPLWDKIEAPVLVFRGDHSTLFPQSIADEMLTRGPGAKNKMQIDIFEGCGHVPGLMSDDQIDRIREWLRQTKDA